MSAKALSVTAYYLFREEGKSRKGTLFCTRRLDVRGAVLKKVAYGTADVAGLGRSSLLSDFGRSTRGACERLHLGD